MTYRRSLLIFSAINLMSAATMGLAPTSAMAEVKFEPLTGKGLVDARDVQRALGWTDRQLRENAVTVQFSYDAAEMISRDCVHPDGTSTPVGTGSRKRHIKLLSAVPSATADPSSPGDGVKQHASHRDPQDKLRAQSAQFTLSGFDYTGVPFEPFCGASLPGGTQMKVTVISVSDVKLSANGVQFYP
jgi:hypothetical protein